MDTHKPPELSLLGVVCDREKREKAIAVFEGKKMFFTLMSLGKGTANSRILGYLGLGETEKAVLFSILPTEVALGVMQALDETMDLNRPGHGIAFMATIHEGCYHKLVHLPTGKEGDTMKATSNTDLIMVILNRGYTEEVMEVARAAGATGGTVLHARGCGLSGAEKFFGVTIQPEKEVLMIVAADDVSCGIMEAIAEKAGPGTDSSAVSFSMPVTGVKGIGLDVPRDML